MDLRDYIHILRRNRWMLALVTLLMIGLSLAYTLQQAPLYQSTTRLFVSTAASDQNQLQQGSQFSIQRVQSYAALLTGDEISRRVVDRLNLNESPRQLTGQISAAASLNTVILVISVTDASADRAELLANAVAKEFVAFVSELETPPGKSQSTVKATIVDAASEPLAPISPRPKRNLGLGLILGLALGAGIAVLRESLDSSVRSAKFLEEATGAPLLGAIMFDSSAASDPTIRKLDSYSPRVEAFRVLRTNLQFIHPDKDNKLFVVTSSLPGEGKTTTAVNLALSLADGGERVALVEADLRRPKLSEYLGVVEAVGLTTVIVGRSTLSDAMQQVGGLDVLTSGRKPPNPAELIKSDAMRELLAELRSQYAYVIIDAPPLLPVTDASLLAAEADGAILVSRFGETTHDEITGAVNRIGAVNAEIVGAILNMAPKAGDNRYGYGYGYGYGYAPENHAAAEPMSKRERKREHKRRAKESRRTGGRRSAGQREAANSRR